MVFRDTIEALHSRCEALDQDLATTRKELDVARRELAKATDELHRVHVDQTLPFSTRELEENREWLSEPPSSRPRALITKVLDLSLSISLFGFIAMVGIATCTMTIGRGDIDTIKGVWLFFAASFVVSLVLQVMLDARKGRR